MTVAEQLDMVPVTVEERIAKLRRRLEDDLEKAERRVDKAEQKVEAASEALAEFDRTIAAIAAEART